MIRSVSAVLAMSTLVAVPVSAQVGKPQKESVEVFDAIDKHQASQDAALRRLLTWNDVPGRQIRSVLVTDTGRTLVVQVTGPMSRSTPPVIWLLRSDGTTPKQVSRPMP